MSSVSPRDKWKKAARKVSSGGTEKRRVERASSVLSTTSMNSIQEEETNQDEVNIKLIQVRRTCFFLRTS